MPAPLPVSRAARDLPESISRVNQRQELVHIALDTPSPGRRGQREWQHCADLLADPDGLATWREVAAEWLLAEYGQAPHQTVAAGVRSWYLQVPAYLATLLFHHERRVPSLRPQDLSFRIAAHGKPEPAEIALANRAFACLPDDPAAGAGEAFVVDSEDRLVQLLRARYAAHAARFVRAYQPTVRFGARNLWGAVTDALDVGMWRAGKQNGDEGAGVTDAEFLLRDCSGPFTSASTLHLTADEHGDLGWTRRKESCCFHYMLSQGKGPCRTCPRVVPPL